MTFLGFLAIIGGGVLLWAGITGESPIAKLAAVFGGES